MDAETCLKEWLRNFKNDHCFGYRKMSEALSRSRFCPKLKTFGVVCGGWAHFAESGAPAPHWLPASQT